MIAAGLGTAIDGGAGGGAAGAGTIGTAGAAAATSASRRRLAAAGVSGAPSAAGGAAFGGAAAGGDAAALAGTCAGPCPCPCPCLASRGVGSAAISAAQALNSRSCALRYDCTDAPRLVLASSPESENHAASSAASLAQASACCAIKWARSCRAWIRLPTAAFAALFPAVGIFSSPAGGNDSKYRLDAWHSSASLR